MLFLKYLNNKYVCIKMSFLTIYSFKLGFPHCTRPAVLVYDYLGMKIHARKNIGVQKRIVDIIP